MVKPEKVAIVTGGARGIGRACAHALARAGHAVALAGADQRADLIVGIAFTGEAQAADGRAEFGHQAVMNPGLCINAARGGAAPPFAPGSLLSAFCTAWNSCSAVNGFGKM